MKFKSLFALSLTVLICTMNSCSTNPYEDPTLTAAVTDPAPNSDLNNYTYSSGEDQLMDLINEYRVNIGLKSLIKTNYISSKALEHNNYMITTNILSHDNFTNRSQDITKALGAKSVAENVAFNSSTAQAAFDAWLASAGHKTNIEGDYTNFGISIRVNSTTGRMYYTNIFAKI